MSKINLLVVGKTRAKFLQEGEQEYLKRLQAMVTLDYSWIPKAKGTPKNHSEIAMQKEKEGQVLLRRLSGQNYIVALDEKGKQYDSRRFAAFLEELLGKPQNITFLIGGPYGLSEEVLQKADARMALSSLTFPHELVRLIFLEQLYRGFTILKGITYHY